MWQADKGADINPKVKGPERRIYREQIGMDPIDPQSNGPQLLYGLRYHIHINTPEEDMTFHDQAGYWLWEPDTGLVMQRVSIPRGQVALAGARELGRQEPRRLGDAARPIRRLLDRVPRRSLPHRRATAAASPSTTTAAGPTTSRPS